MASLFSKSCTGLGRIYPSRINIYLLNTGNSENTRFVFINTSKPTSVKLVLFAKDLSKLCELEFLKHVQIIFQKNNFFHIESITGSIYLIPRNLKNWIEFI